MKSKNIVDYTELWEGLYYKQSTPKNKILLHHTAGYNIESAEYWLRMSSSKAYRESKYFIGVHYFIGKDGKIIKTIPEEYWAWNTGTGMSAIDKSSIAIELDNLGYIKKLTDKTFIDIYNNKWTLISTEINGNQKLYKLKLNNYIIYAKELENEWRGQKYFAIYTEPLINSLFELMEDIINRHNIKRQIHSKNEFFPNDVSYWDGIKMINFSGIITHVQLLGKNKNGYIKLDLSPVFPYEKMVETLKLNIV